jgi:hypothetical protein
VTASANTLAFFATAFYIKAMRFNSCCNVPQRRAPSYVLSVVWDSVAKNPSSVTTPDKMTQMYTDFIKISQWTPTTTHRPAT